MRNRKTRSALPLNLCFIDDDEDDLAAFKQAVENLVDKVVLFRMGADFLASLQKPPTASIVFLDLNMPSVTGFQVIKFMKGSYLYRKLPIVVLSTSREYSARQTSWDLGADLYIVKPNNVQELTEALEYAIGIDWENFVRTPEQFVFRFANNGNH